MKTLVVDIKNEKDSEIIKKLLSVFDVKVTESKATTGKRSPKGKFKSEEEFLSFAGSMKGTLISKEYLREISWKKRNW